MKTKFYILAGIVILLYSCQQKDWTSSNENGLENLDEVPGVNDHLLRKWFALNKESDSIIKSSQHIIDQQREQVESYPQDEREYMNTCIEDAQKQLNLLKEKVKFTKQFAGDIKHYDQSLQQTIDSLEEDYVREKYKLEVTLKELK